MLFIKSKTLAYGVESVLRTRLLEKLQKWGYVPLIRSARLHFYEALNGLEHVKELERAAAQSVEAELGTPYVTGDIFWFKDFALFLIFEDEEGEGGWMRAGIIYGAGAEAHEQKLDVFCLKTSESLRAILSDSATSLEDVSLVIGEWRAFKSSASGSYARFATKHGCDPVNTALQDGGYDKRRRALELLEDEDVRRFLHRIVGVHAGGRLAEFVEKGTDQTVDEFLIKRLSDAGLLRREVLVSCRQRGHVLFRLPSAEALALFSESHAVCNACGAALSDEKTEDLLMTTELSTTLLQDKLWLVNRMRSILHDLNIHEKQIAIGSASGGDEGCLMVAVCGEPFLFMLVEGNLTALDVRRALGKQSETGATHLAIIATGDIPREENAYLREHARRGDRGGDGEVILVERVDAAPAELRRAFEMVSRRAILRELHELNGDLGLNVGHLIAESFRLKEKKNDLIDIAESAASSALASFENN